MASRGYEYPEPANLGLHVLNGHDSPFEPFELPPFPADLAELPAYLAALPDDLNDWHQADHARTSGANPPAHHHETGEELFARLVTTRPA